MAEIKEKSKDICKRVERKIDLMFIFLRNQFFINSLEKELDLIEDENQKEQVKNSIINYKQGCLDILDLIAKVYGEETDKGIAELVQKANMLQEINKQEESKNQDKEDKNEKKD